MVFSCLCCCHSSQKSFSTFVPRESESKVKYRQAINRCKMVLEAAKLAYANELNESITSQKLGCPDYLQIANSVLNESKPVKPPQPRGVVVSI